MDRMCQKVRDQLTRNFDIRSPLPASWALATPVRTKKKSQKKSSKHNMVDGAAPVRSKNTHEGAYKKTCIEV